MQVVVHPVYTEDGESSNGAPGSAADSDLVTQARSLLSQPCLGLLAHLF